MSRRRSPRHLAPSSSRRSHDLATKWPYAPCAITPKKSTHVERWLKFARDLYLTKAIGLTLVPTHRMMADGMTKVVDKDKFFKCRATQWGLRKTGKGAVMLVVRRLHASTTGGSVRNLPDYCRYYVLYVCPMDCGVGPQVRSTRFVVR